eukprot:Clim_evm2s146 gene=Clim_evmTU2s146
MFSFEGQHKSRRNISLRGAAKEEDRKALLARAREERQKRQADRRKTDAATRIQSAFRCHSALVQARNVIRTEYDSDRELQTLPLDLQEKILLQLRRLNFFYSPRRVPGDKQRLAKAVAFLASPVANGSDSSVAQAWVDKEWQEGIGSGVNHNLRQIICNAFELLPHDGSGDLLTMMDTLLRVDQWQKSVQGTEFLHLLFTRDLMKPKRDRHSIFYGTIADLLRKDRQDSPLSKEQSTIVLELIHIPLRLVNGKEGADSQILGGFMSELLTSTLFADSLASIGGIGLTSADLVAIERVESVTNLQKSNDFNDVTAMYLLGNLIDLSKGKLAEMAGSEWLITHLQYLHWLLQYLPDICIYGTDQLYSERESSSLNTGTDPNRRLDYDSDEDDTDDPTVEVTGSGKRKRLSPEEVIQRQLRGTVQSTVQFTRLQKACSQIHSRGLLTEIIAYLHSNTASEGNRMKGILQEVCLLFAKLLQPSRAKSSMKQMEMLHVIGYDPWFLHAIWQTYRAQFVALASLNYDTGDLATIKAAASVLCLGLNYYQRSLDDAEFREILESTNATVQALKGSAELGQNGQKKSVQLLLSEQGLCDLIPILRNVVVQLYTAPQFAELELSHPKDINQLLISLHNRESRLRALPDGIFQSQNIIVPYERITMADFDDDYAEDAMDVSTHGAPADHLGTDLRAKHLVLLKELPFVVPFHHRVAILKRLIEEDKGLADPQRLLNELRVVGLRMVVRRTNIYEDAFKALSKPDTDIKQRIQVTMVNEQGLEEAGLDGGGLFKEFLTEMLKEAFDPKRGLFVTTPNQELYPNPYFMDMVRENPLGQYRFLGRMLGKAIHEQILVELPLAPFFVSRMLGKFNFVNDLPSLDPEFYKNLMALKNYPGNVEEDFGLNFTITDNHQGRAVEHELIRNGRNVAVTNENRIEYIHCVAMYRLNKQIAPQANAFMKGMMDVIHPNWIRMFNERELRTVISGADKAIDVDDLVAHTNYSGAYSPQHRVIHWFWEYVRSLNEEDKGKLLRFVTSCSRPPLLGFRELYPAFCVHSGGEQDRLPSASTCMNLLKLPVYKSRDILFERMTYALNANAGFELS